MIDSKLTFWNKHCKHSLFLYFSLFLHFYMQYTRVFSKQRYLSYPYFEKHNFSDYFPFYEFLRSSLILKSKNIDPIFVFINGCFSVVGFYAFLHNHKAKKHSDFVSYMFLVFPIRNLTILCCPSPVNLFYAIAFFAFVFHNRRKIIYSSLLSFFSVFVHPFGVFLVISLFLGSLRGHQLYPIVYYCISLLSLPTLYYYHLVKKLNYCLFLKDHFIGSHSKWIDNWFLYSTNIFAYAIPMIIGTISIYSSYKHIAIFLFLSLLFSLIFYLPEFGIFSTPVLSISLYLGFDKLISSVYQWKHIIRICIILIVHLRCLVFFCL